MHRFLFVSCVALLGCGVTEPPPLGMSDATTADRAVVTPKCIGPIPIVREAGAPDSGADADVDAAVDAGCSTCGGANAPDWVLADFQPQSCGYTKTYGLDSFRGRATLVALLAGWCGFCQQQARLLEKMRLELEKEGTPVWILTVNAVSGLDYQANLVAQCAFPLFQDLPGYDAWGLHQGQKDDFYVYDAQGKLRTFIPVTGGELSNDLSTPEGYAAVKKALVDATK
jgi:hypothetical protein